MLQHHIITVSYHDMPVKAPEPAAYVLHKFIVSQERKDFGKREKDLRIAGDIGEFLIHRTDQRKRFYDTFNELPSKWQKTLLNVLNMSGNLFLLDLLAP